MCLTAWDRPAQEARGDESRVGPDGRGECGCPRGAGACEPSAGAALSAGRPDQPARRRRLAAPRRAGCAPLLPSSVTLYLPGTCSTQMSSALGMTKHGGVVDGCILMPGTDTWLSMRGADRLVMTALLADSAGSSSLGSLAPTPDSSDDERERPRSWTGPPSARASRRVY